MVVITGDQEGEKVLRRTFLRPFVTGTEDAKPGPFWDYLRG
jgi:hypothetical protein